MNLKEAILTSQPFVDKDGFKYQYLKPTLYNSLKDGSVGDEVDAEYLLGLLLGDEDFKLTAFPVESDLTLVSGLSLLNTNRVLRNSSWSPSIWVYKSTLESLRWSNKDKVTVTQWANFIASTDLWEIWKLEDLERLNNK